MICFSDVSLGNLLKGISFAFDGNKGSSLCIVARRKEEAEAVADLICGLRTHSEGGVSVNCGKIPLVTSQLPAELKVKEIFDKISKAANESVTDAFS